MLTCIPPMPPSTNRSLIVVRQVCLYGLLAVICLASTAQAQYRFDSWTADNGLRRAKACVSLSCRRFIGPGGSSCSRRSALMSGTT